MKQKERIRSIEFSPEGCIINGAEPVPVYMPAEVAPPGSLENLDSLKMVIEPDKNVLLKEQNLGMARMVLEKRAKEKIQISEV